MLELRELNYKNKEYKRVWLILTVLSVGDLLLLGKFGVTQEEVEEEME